MTDKVWLHVTLDYRTPKGGAGSWSGPLHTSWATFHEDAKTAARKAGRKIAKVDRGHALPCPPPQ